MAGHEATHQTELIDTEAVAAALARTWVEIGVDPANLVVHNGTIVPSSPATDEDDTATMLAGDPATQHPDDEAHLPLPNLPPLLGEEAAAALEHVRIGEPLGRGGMGIVSLGTQVPLVRNVAVKALREDRVNPRLARALLREAYILGALEHPNIVPVYLLGRDAQGLPLIVMQRVHGTPWSDYVEGGKPIPEGAGEDALAWHLDVLMQVCNAVSFAHSKGIIHRDLKPSNVMIGDFGEVYLFDWGIAVAVREDLPFEVRLARDVDKVAGTPGFMAPEMAACDGAKIDARTDVYLLGSCLHNILTGEPRHTGESMVNVMVAAYASKPVQYGADVPPELAAIANKATALAREDRYDSAEDFRQALADFLRRRHSGELTREAQERLAQLAELLARHTEEDRLKIYNLFSESRFAFRQALREWPDNAVAETGLQAALEQMAAYELDQGSWKVASMFVAELPRPNARLAARLDEVRARRLDEKRRFEELQQIEHQVDVKVGMGVRGRIVSFIGLFFGAIYVALGQLDDLGYFSAGYGVFYSLALIYGLLLAIASLVYRDVLRESLVNRRYMGVLWIAFVGPFFLWPLCWYVGIELPYAMSGVLLHYFLASLAMAAATEVRIIWASIPFLLSGLAVALAAKHGLRWHYELMGAGVFFALQVFGVLWRPAASAEEGAAR